MSALSHLLVNAAGVPAVYVAGLANVSATAAVLAKRHEQVALLGAGHGSEVRFEDQLAAACIARRLMDLGFDAADRGTAAEIERWSAAEPALISWGKSAEELRRRGGQDEIDFVLNTTRALDLAARFVHGQVVAEVDRVEVLANPRVVGGLDPAAGLREDSGLASAITG